MFEMFRNFDRRQWMIFIVFSISNFCQAICVSLQAPFYPHEAEKKGATATGQQSAIQPGVLLPPGVLCHCFNSSFYSLA